ncbi:MAG TPA: pyrimidine-nucleoside phosphorylase [Bacteroidetes bacterium]|nr:pyrimidine-nucleoside phosphorylase [Bacteroidota bacterium]
MRMVDLILKKRNGAALTGEEIRWFIDGYVREDIPAYQVSALMMAVYFRGMNAVETGELVEAMIASGDTIDLSGIAGLKVDKHSTGGVGDKTSIVLGPMVAAVGVPVGKLSGRGLGHTGGTLDKLESFTGFRIELEMDEFIRNVNEIGIAIAGQTARLVPADKLLYALRDVTGTVENVSLIAGSIMSKKLASGCDAIVLDVKTGSGAFMKTPEAAFDLAKAMVGIGQALGRRTVAIVSDMEQPLGCAVGNALEIAEAIATLKGEGPADLLEICLELGSQMVVLGGKAADAAEARALLEATIANGTALAKLRELVAAQDGDVAQVDNPALLPGAKFELEVLAPQAGYITSLHAAAVGVASMMLGAGRETKSSVIDLGAGIYLLRKRGDVVKKGEAIARLYCNDENKLAGAMKKLLSAYEIGAEAAEVRPLVFGSLDSHDTQA